MEIVALRLVVHGRVQGVGYRDAAIQTAFETGVGGWVRNCRNGTVEIHVQGRPDAVERFVNWCRGGPSLARVTEVHLLPGETDASLRDFERIDTL